MKLQFILLLAVATLLSHATPPQQQWKAGL
jgi:hypothetical protein